MPRPQGCPSLQVEELLVVEASGRARVTGTGDVAGLDLEVRHGVGTGAVGEDQVAVLLVAVGADGTVADEDVADPHGPRTLALQCALVGHAPAGVRCVVVHVDLLLEVLTRVGEVHAERVEVRALTGEVQGRVHPDDLAAERHHDVLEVGVATDGREVAGEVHGGVVPPLHGHDGHVGLFADDDLDVLGEAGLARVLDDDEATAERRGGDDGVRSAGAVAEPAPLEAQGLGLLARDRDRQCLVEARPGVRGGALLRHAGGADAGVVATDPLDAETVDVVVRDRGG